MQVSERYYGVWTKGVPVELGRRQPERAKIKPLPGPRGGLFFDAWGRRVPTGRAPHDGGFGGGLARAG